MPGKQVTRTAERLTKTDLLTEAAKAREEILQIRQKFDPEGKNAAIQDMLEKKLGELKTLRDGLRAETGLIKGITGRGSLETVRFNIKNLVVSATEEAEALAKSGTAVASKTLTVGAAQIQASLKAANLTLQEYNRVLTTLGVRNESQLENLMRSLSATEITSEQKKILEAVSDARKGLAEFVRRGGSTKGISFNWFARSTELPKPAEVNKLIEILITTDPTNKFLAHISGYHQPSMIVQHKSFFVQLGKLEQRTAASAMASSVDGLISDLSKQVVSLTGAEEAKVNQMLARTFSSITEEMGKDLPSILSNDEAFSRMYQSLRNRLRTGLDSLSGIELTDDMFEKFCNHIALERKCAPFFEIAFDAHMFQFNAVARKGILSKAIALPKEAKDSYDFFVRFLQEKSLSPMVKSRLALTTLAATFVATELYYGERYLARSASKYWPYSPLIGGAAGAATYGFLGGSMIGLFEHEKGAWARLIEGGAVENGILDTSKKGVRGAMEKFSYSVWDPYKGLWTEGGAKKFWKGGKLGALGGLVVYGGALIYDAYKYSEAAPDIGTAKARRDFREKALQDPNRKIVPERITTQPAQPNAQKQAQDQLNIAQVTEAAKVLLNAKKEDGNFLYFERNTEQNRNTAVTGAVLGSLSGMGSSATKDEINSSLRAALGMPPQFVDPFLADLFNEQKVEELKKLQQK